MASITDAVASDRPQRTRRRRLGFVLALLVCLLLAAGGGIIIIVRHLDHQYGPLQSGPFIGPYGHRNLIYVEKGGLAGGPEWRLATTPGATARVLEGLYNRGPHSVKVTSIDTDRWVIAARWSVYRSVPGGSVSGVPTPWHEFPAIVLAHGTIRLLITIHRPDGYCPTVPRGPGIPAAYYLGTHTVHWDSLVHSHTTPIAPPSVDTWGVRVC